MKRIPQVAASAAHSKEIVFDASGRARLQRGINKVADAVAVTLGPRGERTGRMHAFPCSEWVHEVGACECVSFINAACRASGLQKLSSR